MSIVYEAVDERLDRLVAVKVMSAALSSDPRFSDRFSREARAAARLSHLNLVAVYDQGVDAGTGLVFLVMELVEGRTLRDLLREHRRFSPAEAISIMEPVLYALAAAHRAGLVHHDVKPENILVGDDGIVKVADFGLARAIESDAQSTRTGLMMGTVAYCSPEQISKGQGTQRSDVYSAGIVLFELLTGAPPYSGETAMNIAYQHVHSRVPAPSSVVPGLPSELDELVIAATDSDPSGRPEDASEFLAELADVRTRLRLPVVPIAPRERIPYERSMVEQRSQTAPAPIPVEQRSTQAIRRPSGPMPPVRGRGVNPTADMRGAVPVSGPTSVPVSGQRSYPIQQPPPPVVISPKGKGHKAGKPARTTRQRARRRGLIVLVVILLLGLVAGGAGWWFSAGRYSKVPSVAGVAKATAEQSLKDAGYKVGTVTTAHDHVVPNGAVISSKPGSGSRLQRGKAINLVVSSGRDMVAIPSLAKGSATKQQIDAAMARAGLDVKYADPKFNDTIPENTLISLSPAVGKPVERGYTTVTVVLSKGPDWVSVPVIGDGAKYDDVATVITQAGLNPVEQEQYSDTVPPGKIILPLNPSDRQVRGKDVTVTVSKGPEMVTIPDDIKAYSNADDAQAELEALGLHVERTTPFGGESSLGYVLSVKPDPGTQVKRGSTVTLSVF
jgi:serine/threonine-protein kinase